MATFLDISVLENFRVLFTFVLVYALVYGTLEVLAYDLDAGVASAFADLVGGRAELTVPGKKIVTLRCV